MSVRNLGELGKSLQLIVTRLLSNDTLIKLLYYTDKDPLNGVALTKEEKWEKIYQNQIKIVPYQVAQDHSCSTIFVYVVSGSKIPGNKEFRNIQIVIDCIIPLDQWIIKDSNLRPYAILGEIQNSLDEKTINGLGELQSGNFELLDLTPEVSLFRFPFVLTDYD